MKHANQNFVVFFSAVMFALLPAFAPGAAEEGPNLITCEGLEFSSAEEPDETVEFDALITVDLTVVLTFSDVIQGEHLLELSFMQPGGQFYQSMAFPIVDGGTQDGQAHPQRKVRGYPFPVTALVPAPSGRAGESEVSIALPIGGTLITSRALYGAWTVVAALDGTRCSSAEVLINGVGVNSSGLLFADGFESGNTDRWSSRSP